jgi:ATP-binding cassette subfamily B protein
VIRTGRRLADVLLGTAFRTAPWMTVACLAMGTIAAASSVLYSIGYRVMIDGAIAYASGRIALGAVLVSVLFTLAWLLGVLGANAGSVLTDRVNLQIGVRVARLAATLPTLEHFEHPERLGRLEQLTRNRRTLAGAPRQLISLFGQGVRAIATVVLLATVYAPILVVPLLALAPALSDRRAATVTQRSGDSLAEDRRLLNDLFAMATSASSASELRTYDIAEELTRRHDELTERVRRRSVRAAMISAGWEAVGWIVFAAGLVAAIVVLVLRAAHGHVSPGQVVMSISLMRRAQRQISSSTDTAGTFNTSQAAARQLLWLEDHERELRPAGPGRPVPVRLREGIRLDGVVFAYPGGGAPVLDRIDLELPAGRSVAVVGENGAGKTTLVKLLCAMYRPTQGQILIDGVDLAELDLTDWRGRLSAAFQDYVRFQFTLGESVGVGDLARIGERDVVRSAMARASADALEERLPDGLATSIGSRYTGGRELSGGEWQRVALARGLMRAGPLLVVLDEPTASLDARAESALFGRYAQAAREAGEADGTITLLISHRFSTVRSADLIVVLERGRVAEVGSHEALLAAGGPYAELYELQARAYA